MAPKLPPPDPHESFGLTPEASVQLDSPTAVFPLGPPSPAMDRLSDAILDLRPGALIVLVRE